MNVFSEEFFKAVSERGINLENNKFKDLKADFIKQMVKFNKTKSNFQKENEEENTENV